MRVRYNGAMNNPPLEVALGTILRQRDLRIAIAESCTGGLICDRITNVAGSSQYFRGGVIAYDYDVKVRHLGVVRDILETYGAVSEEVVAQMARGVRQVMQADIGIAVSGIAGPGGGMPSKSVGLTWIALSTRDYEAARRFVWDGDRRFNKEASAEAALQFMLDFLEA